MTNKKLVEKMIALEERMTNIEENMATKADVRVIMTALDGITRLVVVTNKDVKVLGFRVQRMENWIIKAADRIGLPYST
jgi:hypothetical protein